MNKGSSYFLAGNVCWRTPMDVFCWLFAEVLLANIYNPKAAARERPQLGDSTANYRDALYDWLPALTSHLF